MVIPFQYSDLSHWGGSGGFSHGGAIVEVKDKYGMINRQDQVVIPFKYDHLYPFCGEYAAVELGEQFGYIDSIGNEHFSSTLPRDLEWNVLQSPTEIPDFSFYLDKWSDYNDRPWTLQKLLAHGLTAFCIEPQSYFDRCNLKEICVAYGLLIGGGNYSEDFIYPDKKGWDRFKHETLYKIISSETLREIAWNWVKPYYKEAFRKLHPFHKNIYKEMAAYLKYYINHYNKGKVKAYFLRDEQGFAYYNLEGKPDPYRKLSAFVDRLIIIHQVISEKDAKRWINKMADEVQKW